MINKRKMRQCQLASLLAGDFATVVLKKESERTKLTQYRYDKMLLFLKKIVGHIKKLIEKRLVVLFRGWRV